MTVKKSLPTMIEEYLDEIEQYRSSDPEKYLRCLKLVRKTIDEALSKFSQKEIEEAERKVNMET